MAEHRQENVRTARRACFRHKDLARRARVVQAPEGLVVHHSSQLSARGVDARGERAGGHDVHRARESVLRQHLAIRVEQQRQFHAGLVHEPRQWSFDP